MLSTKKKDLQQSLGLTWLWVAFLCVDTDRHHQQNNLPDMCRAYVRDNIIRVNHASRLSPTRPLPHPPLLLYSFNDGPSSKERENIMVKNRREGQDLTAGVFVSKLCKFEVIRNL